MTLNRINRVQVAKPSPAASVWDNVEKYAAADMVGAAYSDLEVTAATTLEHSRPQIETSGQRGDGEMPASVIGNKDASPSLSFYMRGLDLAGGAGSGVSASAASPQYDLLLEQAAGGAIRNLEGEPVIAGSTRWVLQFGPAEVTNVGYAPGDVLGWVNSAGKLECLPVVEVNTVADTVTVAGDGATGGFSAAPADTDVIYGMRTYSIDQTAGAREHLAVNAQMADGSMLRLFQGCMGSLALADDNGLLVGTWAAQAHNWEASQNLAGAPAFGPFVAPSQGPVSTRGARVLVAKADSWGLSAVGHTPAPVAVATAIAAGFDVGLDIQPRAATTGTNGRQGFVAVSAACSSDVRLYHDGTTADLLAAGSQTFGDGAALEFMDGEVVSLLMQWGDKPGSTVVVEIPAYQANASAGDEGGLATIDLSGRAFRPAFGTASARIHLL